MNLIKLLKTNQDVYNFTITTNKKKSCELFFALSNLETVRRTNVIDTKVNVIVKNGDFMGESSFSVFASDNQKAVVEKINDAVKSAKFIKNQPYELPAEEHTRATIKSSIKRVDFIDLGKKIYELAKDAIAETSSTINALEIFINEKQTQIKNGFGLDKKMTYYDLFIEAIPTFDKGDESFELYQAINVADFDPKQIKTEIKDYLDQVKNRAFAIKPDFKIEAPVILNKDELAQLFDEYAYLCTYPVLYSHSNLFEVGDMLVSEAKGDKITMTARAKIKGSADSRIFDVDGLTLKDKLIIEDNKVVSFFGGNRFAQYLNMEKTGNLPCIEVEAGSLDFNEVEKNPYFEALSFSGIQVDPFSDYLGGEVRLAKYFDGKEVKYITGVSISASLSEVLKDIKFSNKLAQTGSYLGPDKALVKMEIL